MSENRMSENRMKGINEKSPWQDMTVGGVVLAGGNSVEFLTGDWRTQTPVWHPEKCKQCLMCFPYCPDSSIPVQDRKRLDFDLDHCKGCGICAAVCPFDAIEIR